MRLHTVRLNEFRLFRSAVKLETIKIYDFLGCGNATARGYFNADKPRRAYLRAGVTFLLTGDRADIIIGQSHGTYLFVFRSARSPATSGCGLDISIIVRTVLPINDTVCCTLPATISVIFETYD